jgi:hypothetical protein
VIDKPPPLRELTTEEALLLAMALAPDGEAIAVHQETCWIATTGRCSCTPEVTTVRRSRA